MSTLVEKASTSAVNDNTTSIASMQSALEALPNEILYNILEHLLAQSLISFGEVSRYTRALVAIRSKRLSEDIIAHETKRLQDAMQVSMRPNYKGSSLFGALRVWCVYWGRPHPARYREACSHFAEDYDKDNVGLIGVCMPRVHRLYFWSHLAEFLLRVSDIKIEQQARPQERISGRTKCSDWIENRAHAQFQETCDFGTEFLDELRNSTSDSSGHMCVDRMLSCTKWLDLAQSARADPIRRLGISIITIQATNRRELDEAVRKGMAIETPLNADSTVIPSGRMAMFEDEIVKLPRVAPGFSYVPIPTPGLKGNDAKYAGSCSVEGVRMSQAAKLARQICKLSTNTEFPSYLEPLLRAAFMEVMDVCDSPLDFERRSRHWRGKSWRNSMEQYDEKSVHVRANR